MFFYRAGQNLGNRAYFPRHDKDEADAAILEAFIGQFYDNRPAPKLILVNQAMPGQALLAEALSVQMAQAVHIRHPQRGAKAALLTHAAQNAQEALARHQAESASQRRLLQQLADVFDLEAPPQRIEIFDNSHLQGSNQLGGMVVAGSEGFLKNQYRKFNIKDAATKTGR